VTVQPLNRLQAAWRAAQDIGDGMVVNLGLGMPLHVADYLRPEVDVFIQSENGVIGIGPLAPADRIDADLVDAGSRRITLRPGASIVDSSWWKAGKPPSGGPFVYTPVEWEYCPVRIDVRLGQHSEFTTNPLEKVTPWLTNAVWTLGIAHRVSHR
jgi:hypothetical protein